MPHKCFSKTLSAPAGTVSKKLAKTISKWAWCPFKRFSKTLRFYKVPLNVIVTTSYFKYQVINHKESRLGKFHLILLSFSFDYEDCGYQTADLIKLSILLNGREVEELASIVHRDNARLAGKAICSKLSNTIPRQMYEVAIQAAVGSKIMARENIKALKKNVLAKCVSDHHNLEANFVLTV